MNDFKEMHDQTRDVANTLHRVLNASVDGKIAPEDASKLGYVGLGVVAANGLALEIARAESASKKDPITGAKWSGLK